MKLKKKKKQNVIKINEATAGKALLNVSQTFFEVPLSIISLILGDDGGDTFCTGLNGIPPFVFMDSQGDFLMDNDCDVTVVVVLVPNVDICPPRPNGKRDLDFLRHPYVQ